MNTMQTTETYGLVMGQFEDDELVDLFETTLQDELDDGADVCDPDWEIVAIDEDGERVTGDPVGDGEGPPSIELLKEYFSRYPEAVELSIQGTSYVYGRGFDDEEREIFGWWSVEIFR